MPECSLFSTSFPVFIICRFFDDGHSEWSEVIPHCCFDLHFSNNARCWVSFPLFIGHLYVFFGEVSVLDLLPVFFIGLFVFLLLSCISCLYTLEINHLSVVSLVVIFSHSEGCLFKVAHCSLCCAKAFKFNQVPFVYFCFYFHYSRRWTKEDLAVIYVRVFCLCFSLRAL